MSDSDDDLDVRAKHLTNGGAMIMLLGAGMLCAGLVPFIGVERAFGAVAVVLAIIMLGIGAVGVHTGINTTLDIKRMQANIKARQ
jgi:hypothetical protein